MLGEKKNTDSTYSFNWKVAIWVKQGRITQFNYRDTPQPCLKYFLQGKIQLQQEFPDTILPQVGWGHQEGWFRSRRPLSIQISPDSALLYQRSCSDMYSVCSSVSNCVKHAARFNNFFPSFEEFSAWKLWGAQNSARGAPETPQCQALGFPGWAGSRTTFISQGTERNMFIWEPQFCKSSWIPCCHWKLLDLKKAEMKRKILSLKGTMGKNKICFSNLLFEPISSCRSEFSLFQKLSWSNKTKL